MSHAANAHNDGRDFQNGLKQINTIYERQGLAAFEKIDPPVRIIGWGPNRKVIFQPNPWLDFSGCLTSLGHRAAHFEAKSTKEPILPMDGERSLKRTQLDAMRRWRAAGAAAWLLWEYDGTVKLWFMSMIEAALTERQSLRFEDGLQVPAGKGFVFWDWIEVVKKYPEEI